MKRVLLAAYYFPPMAGVGWVRVTKFAKYLPRVGWSPLVVTVDGRHYSQVVKGDEPPELESLDVCRIPYRPWRPLFLTKLLFPLYVLAVALRQRRRLDAIVLFGSPFHPILFTPLLRVLTGLPVVLDLRDGWSTVHERIDAGRLRLVFNPVRRLIEWTGFSSCCAAVFATEILKQQYSRLFPSRARDFVTVSNGFDPEDFISCEPGPAANEKIILLAGKLLFYTPQVAQWLFEALADYPDWRFVYIGEEAEAVASLARRVGAQSRVEVRAYQPYQQVLKEVARAGLCVTTNTYPEGLGTKIFDYLALQKRVLCFVPAESEIANQFSGVPGMVVCREPHTREGVADGLRRALDAPPLSKQVVAAYSRKQKASELADVLNRCTISPGAASDA